jgi:hypothetical protein
MITERLRITFNLAMATCTSLVDAFFPEMLPGTTTFLVKKIERLMIKYGFTGGD